MMKRTVTILYMTLLCFLMASAQEVIGEQEIITAPQPVVTTPRPTMPDFSPQWTGDSLHLPLLNQYGQMPYINSYPLYWGGYYNWLLHEGLNVNIGASVFAGFGKHAPHGAGFQQNISAMYAMPLTDKLSFAVGGYFNNVWWQRNSYRDAGINGVLAYRFNDHWEAYLYGQKSLTDKKYIPYPLYDMSELGDRIGAAVRYNVNPSFSIQVSVEQRDMPNRFLPIFAPSKTIHRGAPPAYEGN
mgnify:FL=1